MFDTVLIAKSFTISRSRYVALKILIAGPPSRSIHCHDHNAPAADHNGDINAIMINEIRILQRLSDPSSAFSHSGSAHVLSLIDHFIILGPNGAHHVLATEITGPTVSSIPKPSAVVRELCRQLVEAVDYLHQLGIMHGGKQHPFWPTLSTYLYLV